jgi:prolyl-tRNA editing enzyme YbaK/EbsC (Cys-tRNA(Pro) deacylase)
MGHAVWPESVERVSSFLRAAAVDARVQEFPDGTPTARDAARAVGCELGQIVKSLVFVCDGAYVLALVPGDGRADEKRVAAGAEARRVRVARAQEVENATGFEPGAVAPFPSRAVRRTLIDRSLLRHEVVWIGAGSPAHMAAIAPGDLQRLAEARPWDLIERG